MEWTEMVELASGWRVPDDSGKFEEYLRHLNLFAQQSTQGGFWQFIVELRRRGLASRADYMVTVYPAVRLYITRFGETPGRLIVGYMETSHAGAEEDEDQYISRLQESAPNDRFVIWFSFLRHERHKESDASRIRWEQDQLRLLGQRYPGDSLVGEASGRIRQSGKSLIHQDNEDLWSRIFGSLWDEYGKAFPDLLR